MTAPDPRVSVVIVTRNRVSELLTTLEHLRSLPEQPHIAVVDNASTDGTSEAARRRHPEVEVVTLAANLGGAGRNVGVRRVDTPYVAFSDDDSWWSPGSLARAADLFEAYPRLAALAARVLVGPQEKEDPICDEMANSPLEVDPDMPGPPVRGFLGCAVVVRRPAYLEVGGYEPRMQIGGEEELLAADLAAAGWELVYVDAIVAHHHPSTVRNPVDRRRSSIRNALWFAWLRRPLSTAARHTLLAARAALKDADVRDGLIQALRGLPWAVRYRRVLPRRVEEDLRLLDREGELRAPK
jgi:GT2 family glycosyltransferase